MIDWCEVDIDENGDWSYFETGNTRTMVYLRLWSHIIKLFYLPRR